MTKENSDQVVANRKRMVVCKRFGLVAALVGLAVGASSAAVAKQPCCNEGSNQEKYRDKYEDEDRNIASHKILRFGPRPTNIDRLAWNGTQKHIQVSAVEPDAHKSRAAVDSSSPSTFSSRAYAAPRLSTSQLTSIALSTIDARFVQADRGYCIEGWGPVKATSKMDSEATPLL